jgi:hypothetical protein
MSRLQYHRLCGLPLAGLMVLVGCGGGGERDDTPADAAPTYALAGTAAAGRPLVGATVTLKDAAGRSASQTTAADGSYRFPDVANLVWPLIAEVSGGNLGCTTATACTVQANNARYIGVALGERQSESRLNLSPMTHAIVSAAAGRDAGELFTLTSALSSLNAQAVASAQQNVLGWLARLDPQTNWTGTYDFLSGSFKAAADDLQDRLLDSVGTALSTLQLDQADFARLVGTDYRITTTPPVVPLFCDIAGRYNGVFSGSNSGVWSVQIDPGTGRITGMAADTAGMPSEVTGLSTRSGVGTLRASATLGAAGASTFVGSISSALVLSGSWSNPLENGSFSGQRVEKAQGCD